MNYKDRLSDKYAKHEYSCPICKNKFTGKRSFKVHYANTHMDKWHKKPDNSDERYQRWKMNHDEHLLKVVFGLGTLSRFRKEYDLGNKENIPSDVLRYFGLVDKFSSKPDKPDNIVVDKPVYLDVDTLVRKLSVNPETASKIFKARIIIPEQRYAARYPVVDMHLNTSISGDEGDLPTIVIKSLICKIADDPEITDEASDVPYKAILEHPTVLDFINWIEAILDYIESHETVIADLKNTFIKINGKRVVSFTETPDSVVFTF